VQFWFVSVPPKYINFAIFSKDLLAVSKLSFVLHFSGEM
jgi:hypothetical protein